MTLQRRLTLFFIFIVILPLAAAGFVVQRVVVGEVSRRAELGLSPSLNSAVMRYNERSDAIEGFTRAAIQGSARFATLLERSNNQGIDGFLATRLNTFPSIDFLIALDSEGRRVGSSLSQARFVNGFPTPTPGEILAADAAGPGFRRTAAMPVRSEGDSKVGSIVGGFWLDDDLLAGTQQSNVDTLVVVGNRVLASTMDAPRPPRIELGSDETSAVELDGPGKARVSRIPGSRMAIVAWTPDAPVREVSRDLISSMLGLLVLALLATAALAYVLARLITKPLDELSDGARAISQGRYSHRIPVRSGDEVGQVATAFNEMSGQLEETITDLASSRDSLQRAIQRVGETLRSTHDMGQILGSIINTAADAIAADAAALYVFTPARNELYPAIASGVDMDELERIMVGKGVIGLVAERGVRVLIPTEAGGPQPSRYEPDFPVLICIPLYSADRIMGVLALYRGDEEAPFDRKDLETVVFLAEQGGVAIENVMLHEEAQRLSLTDGLTGVWNRRYLQMQFRQTLASATRFERPFSVLMLDLDRFKEVNDTYGHQRGDAILVEFTRRVNSNLREIDTFARYGGEEFVCLLSETDLSGAQVTAEKIRAAIQADPFVAVGEAPVSLTVSIGISAYPSHGTSYSTLVEAADQGLYRAKQEGRNRVCVAEPPAPGLHLAK